MGIFQHLYNQFTLSLGTFLSPPGHFPPEIYEENVAKAK